MDNKVFNVNGLTKKMLLITISLALENTGFDWEEKNPKVDGWAIDGQKGFVLLKFINEKNKSHKSFPVPLDASQITDIVWSWLNTDDAKKIKLDGWDVAGEHDGDNVLGWRVYCEDWGHIGSDNYALVAIKPAYIWYGK